MRMLPASVSLLLLLAGAVAAAQSAPATPPKQRKVLIELFTSEGCSSCPPADDLLRELNGKTAADGAEIVGIGEHVTYWDYLGWHDRYDKPVFDQRQQRYSERFGKDGVYTPQLVVNGESEVVGSSRGAVQQALSKPRPASSAGVEITAATLTGGYVQIGYRVTGKTGSDADLFAAVVQDAIPAKVTRGENSGTTLAHASVARVLARIATVHGAAEGQTTIPLEALATGAGAPPARLLLFVQSARLGPVLAVETSPLTTAAAQTRTAQR